jgi:hypothetical protein
VAFIPCRSISRKKKDPAMIEQYPFKPANHCPFTPRNSVNARDSGQRKEKNGRTYWLVQYEFDSPNDAGQFPTHGMWVPQEYAQPYFA